MSRLQSLRKSAGELPVHIGGEVALTYEPGPEVKALLSMPVWRPRADQAPCLYPGIIGFCFALTEGNLRFVILHYKSVAFGGGI